MPTAKKLIKEKLERLENIPRDFAKSIEKLQGSVLDEVLKDIRKLKIKDGKVVTSKANLRIASSIVERLKSVLNKAGYKRLVSDFSKEFNNQGKITRDYLKEEFGEFKETAFAKEFIKEQRREVVTALIGNEAIRGAVQKPLSDVVTQAIANNGSLKNLIRDIRLITTGNSQRDGLLHRYARQIAFDSFAQSDRAYTKQASDKVGAQFFLYQGGKLETTRDFCRARDGKYFHREEIEDFPSEGVWQGQIPGTNSSNIFTRLGGYNCQHGLIPVGITTVPKSVLIRNLENGNLELTERQRAQLGI